MEPESVFHCETCGNTLLGDRSQIHGTDRKWIIDGNHSGPGCRNGDHLDHVLVKALMFFFYDATFKSHELLSQNVRLWGLRKVLTFLVRYFYR